MRIRIHLVVAVGLALVAGVASADEAEDFAAKVRKCSAWCVTSYKGAVAESLSCIDSCQRNRGNHPVAMCAKGCVGKHVGQVPAIVDCIDRCGTRNPAPSDAAQ